MPRVYERTRPRNQVDIEDVAADPRPGMSAPKMISFTADDKRIGFFLTLPGSGQRLFFCDIDENGLVSEPAHFVKPDFPVRGDAERAHEARMRHEDPGYPSAPASGIFSYCWGSKHSPVVLLQANGSVYLQLGAGEEPRLLVDATSTVPGLAGGPIHQPKLSPDERVLAFVRGGEVHVLNVCAPPATMAAATGPAEAGGAMEGAATGAPAMEHTLLSATHEYAGRGAVQPSQMGELPLGVPVQRTHGSMPGITHGIADPDRGAHRRGVPGLADESSSAEKPQRDAPPMQLTHGANTTIHHGLADHSAQTDMERFEGFWWSNCSKWIAFQETDESSIPEFVIAHHSVADGRPYESIRYPFAGGNNAVVRVGIIMAEGSSQPLWLDLGIDWVRRKPLSAEVRKALTVHGIVAGAKQPPEESAAKTPSIHYSANDYGSSGYKRFSDGYVASVTWGHDSVYVQVQDRSQRALRLIRYAAPSIGSWSEPYPGASPLLGTIVIEELANRWVNLHTCFHELSDGSLVWGSAHSGHFHLNRFSPTGRCEAALTSGDWIVDSLEAIDEEANRVYFTCSLPEDSERNLYSVPLFANRQQASEEAAPSQGDPSRTPWAEMDVMPPPFEEALVEPSRLTPDSGWHEVTISHAMELFVDVHSSVDKPFAVGLRRLPDGQALSVIYINNDDPRIQQLSLKPPECIHIHNASGDKLRAVIYHPPAHFKRPLPLVVSCYGGPGVQITSNNFSLTAAMREQMLAQAGYCVMRLDNRGSARRGVAFEQALYGQFGLVEVSDQVTGVKHLVDAGLVDGSRVGAYGWSYGGYLALLCLEHAPDVFTAACCGAPVTHWAGYETHFTERHIGLPDENVQGYVQSSALAYVDRISSKARLMIIHGLLDSNVHFRHTALLVDALNQHRKHYDLLVFPEERHPASDVISNRIYLEERVFEFFQSALGIVAPVNESDVAEFVQTARAGQPATRAAAAAGE